MNRKVSILVVGVAILSIAVTAVTASSFSSYTPLYTVRMEQESSEMNFLPTEVNDLTYTAETGSEFNYKVTAVNGEDSILQSGHSSCIWTCIWSTCNTCSGTCYDTCPYTCANTCHLSTCASGTCASTCEGGQC